METPVGSDSVRGKATTARLPSSRPPDEVAMLRSGMTGQGYFLPDGPWVPQGELEGINPDGTPAEQVPSTVGVSQPLIEATATDLLDLQVATAET